MKWKVLAVTLAIATSATLVSAQSFGVHAGYYTQDLKQVFIGADWMMPVGPAALMPNIDFARKNGIDYWFGSVDLDLRYPTSGTSFWFGAGPTYGYLNGSGFSDHQWGWDVNAGVGLGGGAMKPYITGRYIKIKDFKTSGAAIGLRF